MTVIRLGKHWDTVNGYAQDIVSGRKIACQYQIKGVQRFLRDLEDERFDFDAKDADFCIDIIEKTMCHQQGESLDGTPLRGTPFLLQPFQKYIIYNLVGFKGHNSKVVRFHEALIYIPRKNGKTGMAGAFAWALALLYRRSGSKCYIASAALIQSMESFNFMTYNIKNMGEWDKDGGSVHINDNHNDHSFSATLPDGSFFVKALAASPDKQDSLNCSCAILDEIHAFKQPKQYNLFQQAMKAYSNKLLIGISTAGDNAQGFLGKRLEYCKKILDGIVEDEQYFIFICEADADPETGEVDYTNPYIHEMANPN